VLASATTRAGGVEWRDDERFRQRISGALHLAAAIDLASDPSIYSAVPTDGPVDDLLTSRTASPVPSIHISRAAGRLALAAVLTEMGRRAGRTDGWRGHWLAGVAELSEVLPELFDPSLNDLAGSLPELAAASRNLRDLDGPDLARVAGRTYEMGLNQCWVFADRLAEPKRLWDPWRAKQQGCFFTPTFVARYMAKRALVGNRGQWVLDPALGSGALLVEAFLLLQQSLPPREAHERLYGVDLEPGLVALTAAVLEFLATGWSLERPDALGIRFRTGDSLLAQSDSWTSWFPEPMNAGGFTAAIMNPPYGQLKINASSLPVRGGDTDDAIRARNIALDQARTRAAQTAVALREHPDYRFAHGGVPDLPRFFIERSLTLLAPGGRTAAIVPSTFLADHRSSSLRGHLLEDHRLVEVDLLPEDARLFTDVNQPTCVIVVDARRRPRRFALRQHVVTPAGFRARPDAVIDVNLIKRIDPLERRIPNCSATSARHLSQLHEHPRLGSYPWLKNLRGELDLTLHREYLREGRGLALIRGDQIDRFRADRSTDKAARVSRDFLEDAITDTKYVDTQHPRLAGPQCAYLKKPRRLAFALIREGSVIANSCNYIAFSEVPDAPLTREEALLYVMGVLNSEWLEWRFRATSSTNHVGNYELDALPLPDPRQHMSEVTAIVDLARELLATPDSISSDTELNIAVSRMFDLPERPPE
jgi:Alw26I/Eco31I/Esp3I family type II restriction m6 adenine DNA methyltransferase